MYALVFAQPDELTKLRGDALATIGYVANWRPIFTHQSYFDQFAVPSPLRHTWSLAIEEQWYAVWPLIVAPSEPSSRLPADAAAGRSGAAGRRPSFSWPGSTIRERPLARLLRDRHAGAVVAGRERAGDAASGAGVDKRCLGEGVLQLLAVVSVVYIGYIWVNDGRTGVAFSTEAACSRWRWRWRW